MICFLWVSFGNCVFQGICPFNQVVEFVGTEMFTLLLSCGVASSDSFPSGPLPCRWPPAFSAPHFLHTVFFRLCLASFHMHGLQLLLGTALNTSLRFTSFFCTFKITGFHSLIPSALKTATAYTYFLVCFLVASGRKINLALVTPSWPEDEVRKSPL